jgi:hypothetical protein
MTIGRPMQAQHVWGLLNIFVRSPSELALQLLLANLKLVLDPETEFSQKNADAAAFESEVRYCISGPSGCSASDFVSQVGAPATCGRLQSRSSDARCHSIAQRRIHHQAASTIATGLVPVIEAPICPLPWLPIAVS